MSGPEGAPPLAASVILATSAAHTIRRTLGDWARQTAAARLEIVVVAPAAELAALGDGPASPLARFTPVVAAEPFELAPARALGVLAASAPYVFVGETHSFPRPDALEHLLAELERSAGADGDRPLGLVPAIDNANPSGAVSWASLLVDYGAWGPGQPAGPCAFPPTYNGLFDRPTVAALGERLTAALSPHDETVFPLPLGAGSRARSVPAAVVDHLNVERLGDALASKRWLGLAVGAHRARRWSWPRRLAYAAAAPLVALVLLRRYALATLAVGRARRLPALVWPLLPLLAALRAAGETQGLLTGEPAANRARLEHLEVHKAEFVSGWRE